MRLFYSSVLTVLLAASAQSQFCDFLGKDSLFVEYAGDTVNVWDMAACGYCSSRFAIDAHASADSLIIVQTDTVKDKTTCDCLFNLKAGIAGLMPQTYTAYLFRQELQKYGYPVDRLVFVGSIGLTVQPGTPGVLRWDAYQSPCIVSSLEEPESPLPARFTLHQNYANPFNPTTTIEYDLEGAAEISLSVFDVLGREVALLEREYKRAGHHSVVFDASTLPSGVYFYRLRAGTQSQTRRLIVLR